MLRLRASIERARERRFFAILVVLLLVLVVVFGVAHEAEHAVADAAAVCVAIVALLTTLAVVARQELEPRRPGTRDQGPPRRPSLVPATRRHVLPPGPLRL